MIYKNEITEVISVKTPIKCSSAELQDFAALVLAGGEVTALNLNERIKNAEALAFLSQDNCLKGIAAIKIPELNYKVTVFQKAKATIKANQFMFELGWIFVLPSSRGAGFSHKLVEAALSATNGQPIFATSRSDNVPMHKVLNAHGFHMHGKAYPSSLGNQSLFLFICNGT